MSQDTAAKVLCEQVKVFAGCFPVAHGDTGVAVKRSHQGGNRVARTVQIKRRVQIAFDTTPISQLIEHRAYFQLIDIQGRGQRGGCLLGPQSEPDVCFTPTNVEFKWLYLQVAVFKQDIHDHVIECQRRKQNLFVPKF